MRKIRKSPFWAGTIAILILFMNVFPLVALAEGASLDVPKLEAPNYKAPELKTPEWENPPLKTPQWETPKLQAPQTEVPLQPPGLEAPNTNVPNHSTGGGQSPAGNGNPQVPFLQSPGYDALKLSFKDTIGGTLGYTSSLITQGEVDLQSAMKSKGLFLTGLGFKMFDIPLKNTQFGSFTGLGVDVFDALAMRDNYLFVVSQHANSTLANQNILRQLPFTGAANASNPIVAPGLATKLFVGAAVISLPFDALDTWNNFDQSNDSNLSKDKQNEKFVDGVGGLGSTLMDAGVIASVIPGGQTVGTVLLVTGAVLWGISRLVKYGDKLSGGAISRGIREGVSRVVGWVKSIFA